MKSKQNCIGTKKTSQITYVMHKWANQNNKSFEIYARKVRQGNDRLTDANWWMMGATNPTLIFVVRLKRPVTSSLPLTAGLRGAYNSTILRAVMAWLSKIMARMSKENYHWCYGWDAGIFPATGEMAPIFELRALQIIRVLMKFKDYFKICWNV